MDDARKIPLVIGVTGHLDLREEELETLRSAVKRELEKLREKYPHTPAVMLCALARGADLLCADAGEEAGIPLRAVLPMEREEYEKDFGEADLARFRHHLDRAEKVYTAADAKEAAENAGRDGGYRRAGIHTAEHSHILLALWDGKEGGPNGTAAAVNAVLRSGWQPRHGTASRCAENAVVIHIQTSRKGAAAEGAGTVRTLGNAEAMAEILSRTDEFNALAEQTDAGGERLLPEDAGAEPELRKLETLYRTADRLSMRFAGVYRRVLIGLAASGTLLTLAFLLYDERDMIPMILLCGAMLVTAFLLAGRAKRTACHRRYIEYRALAEALRVQMYLRYAGSGIEAQRLMSWTQRMETAWILCAVCAANAERAPEKKREIRECWPEAQEAYHRKAGRNTGRQNGRNDRLVKILLRCSVAAYLATLAIELLGCGLIFRPVIEVRDPGRLRTLMKIVLGALSAGTLFLSGYYGKMDLGRKMSDHVKMEAFYRSMSEQLAEQGQTENLLEALAREELAENGNWCSYQRDNAPELNL